MRNALAPRSLVSLAGFVSATSAAAGIGSLSGAKATTAWYRRLRKPPFTPPSWVFGPVWSALYLMMAIAAWRISRRNRSSSQRRSLLLWWAQLGLNAAWTPLFFGARRPKAAMVDIVALWLAIAADLNATRRTDRVGAAMLFPYFSWVSFAALLNEEIIRRNR